MSVLVAVGSVPAASAVAVGPDPVVVPVVEGVGGFDPLRSTVVEELTGPSTLVYANPDGSRTAVAASGPVRYRDGAGWRDLDPTLVGGPGGLVGRAVPAGGPVLPLFADGPLALRAADGTALEVRRVGVPRVPGVPVGSVVGYEDGVGGGRGLRLRLLNGGEVEEEVVVPVRPADVGAASSWQVEVGVPDGWSAREAGGAVELVDASGGLGLRVAGGPARDGLEPEPAEAAVTAVLVGSAGGWATVRFGVDPGWLAAPERVFPVVLDPSYTTTFSAGDTSDTYISSSNPNTPYWLDAGLKVGTPNGIIKQRSFLNWDLSTVKAGGPKVVVGASLRLWETAAFSCNPAALTVGPSSALAVEATTWNSGPATAIDPKTSKSFAHRGASGSCPAAQEVIDVKEMAKAWVYDLAPQLGTALIAQEDPLPPPADARSGWKKFTSGDAAGVSPCQQGGISECSPSLEITYTPEYDPSSLPGGGFVNVMDISPQDAPGNPDGRLLAGTDLAGMYRSDDKGRSWQPANTGLAGGHKNTFGIAAIAFNPFDTAGTVPGEVVALAGRSEVSDPLLPRRLLVSGDGGGSWGDLGGSLSQSQIPIPAAQLPPGSPRFGGRLVAWVNKDLLYVGGYDGLFRYSRPANGSWCATGYPCGQVLSGLAPSLIPPGNHVRSLALDKDTLNPSLFVAADTKAADDTTSNVKSTIWKVNPSSVSTPTASTFNDTFLKARDVRVVRVGTSPPVDELFVAAGTQGLYGCSTTTNPVCTLKAEDGGWKPNALSDWSDLDATDAVGSTPARVYMACSNCQDSVAGDTQKRDGALVRWQPVGSTWTTPAPLWQTKPTTGPGMLDLKVPWDNAAGDDWWLSKAAPEWMLGSAPAYRDMKSYRNTGVVVINHNPGTESQVYLAGQTEVWYNSDINNVSQAWKPGVVGVGSNVTRDVTGLVQTPNKYVAVADTDWRAPFSAEGFLTGNAQPPVAFHNVPGSLGTFSVSIAHDDATGSVGDYLYAGVGGKDITDPRFPQYSELGEVYVCRLDIATPCLPGNPFATPQDPTKVVNLGLRTAIMNKYGGNEVGSRVLGVAAHRVSTGNGWFVIASTDGRGLWAKRCTTPVCNNDTTDFWSQISTTIAGGRIPAQPYLCAGHGSGNTVPSYSTPENLHVTIQWPAGTNKFFVFDPVCGVYRSTDVSTWTTNTNPPSLGNVGFDLLVAPTQGLPQPGYGPSLPWRREVDSGYMAASVDAAAPGVAAGVTLYVSTLNGAFKITNADTVSAGTGTTVGTTRSFGSTASGISGLPGGAGAKSGPVTAVSAYNATGPAPGLETAGRVVFTQKGEPGVAGVFMATAKQGGTVAAIVPKDNRWAQHVLVPSAVWVDPGSASSPPRVYTTSKGGGLAVLALQQLPG